MHESELLTRIAARSVGLLPGAGWAVVVGPGDDAAVMRSPTGECLILTVDHLVEGLHFTPGTAIDLIARKAVARSVSDIAAMGAAPAWGLATALLPAGYPHADELFDALARWAAHWHCPLVGGDTAFHSAPDHPLTLTVTVGGSMPPGHTPVLRSGARPGDAARLTGPIGGSFAAGRHLSFDPRLDAGLRASRHGSGVHAMIDLSDGLGRDADRVARASGVVIDLHADRIPMNLGVPGWRAAASDGEDYELLILAAPDAPADPALLGPIGHARACKPQESPGAFILDSHGVRHPASEMGWDHRNTPAPSPG